MGEEIPVEGVQPPTLLALAVMERRRAEQARDRAEREAAKWRFMFRIAEQNALELHKELSWWVERAQKQLGKHQR